MNLQQLYYFQAISRLKNYTKAAEQLLVAQSSLSHSIGDLERELGVPLFFKVGRNIDITEYGKQFLIHVDRITAELELANQELKNMLNPNMGKIRIALAYTVSNRFIPNMIKGFYENEDNRAIQFEFSEKQAAKIIDAFANRTLDLGFGARMDSDQLEYFHIFDEEIVAVVSSCHPLALRGSVKLQDLIREPMVSYTYNCGTRYWIDDVFRRFQLTPNIIQEVDTEKVMASAVASGLGVALMPRITELSIYDVVPLTLENSELHRPMFMCWPKGRPCGQWSKIFGTTLWTGWASFPPEPFPQHRGAMSRIYRKAERRCPGRVGSVFLQEKRKQKSADQAQRDLWEDHDQN